MKYKFLRKPYQRNINLETTNVIEEVTRKYNKMFFSLQEHIKFIGANGTDTGYTI